MAGPMTTPTMSARMSQTGPVSTGSWGMATIAARIDRPDVRDGRQPSRQGVISAAGGPEIGEADRQGCLGCGPAPGADPVDELGGPSDRHHDRRWDRLPAGPFPPVREDQKGQSVQCTEDRPHADERGGGLDGCRTASDRGDGREEYGDQPKVSEEVQGVPQHVVPPELMSIVEQRREERPFVLQLARGARRVDGLPREDIECIEQVDDRRDDERQRDETAPPSGGTCPIPVECDHGSGLRHEHPSDPIPRRTVPTLRAWRSGSVTARRPLEGLPGRTRSAPRGTAPWRSPTGTG